MASIEDRLTSKLDNKNSMVKLNQSKHEEPEQPDRVTTPGPQLTIRRKSTKKINPSFHFKQMPIR